MLLGIISLIVFNTRLKKINLASGNWLEIFHPPAYSNVNKYIFLIKKKKKKKSKRNKLKKTKRRQKTKERKERRKENICGKSNGIR